MEIIDLGGEIYVMISFLKKYSVIENSIYNGISKNRHGKSRYYEHITHPKDKRVILLKYNSISPYLFKKYMLPPECKLFDVIDERESKLNNLTRVRILFAYKSGYKRYEKLYLGFFYDPYLIKTYARTYAVFFAIIESKDHYGIDLRESFEVFKELDGLQFETNSIKSFYHKLEEFRKKKHLTFLHGSLGLTKVSHVLTEDHVKTITKLYRNSSQFSYRQIHKKVNLWAIKNGFGEVSLSSIKKVLADPVVQNECKPFRNGKEWAKRYTDPFHLMEHPEHNGDLWEIDGSKFQFAFNNEGKIDFLMFFAVMDVHSRKIVGCSFDTSENHKMVIQALNNAVEETGYVPCDMVMDNAPAFRHSKFVKLRHHFSILGCYVMNHEGERPEEKGHIEKFFDSFQSMCCKGKDGYIGAGIMSKRESDRRPRAELLKSLKKKNLRSRTQLEEFLKELIEEYNNHKVNEERYSPFISFEIAKAPNSNRISDNEKALMFWRCIPFYKVRRSTIILSEGSYRKHQFQYIIKDIDLRNRLNGQTVKVCYLKEDRSIIKLFDDNDCIITTLDLVKPLSASKIRRQRQFKNEKLEVESSFKNDQKRPKSKNKNKVKQNLFEQEATLEILAIENKKSN